MEHCQEIFLVASRTLPSDEGVPVGGPAGEANSGPEGFLKWVDAETPPSLKKNNKYAFLAPVALYF